MFNLGVAPFICDRPGVGGLSLPSDPSSFFHPLSDITLRSENRPVFVAPLADITLPSDPRPVLVDRRAPPIDLDSSDDELDAVCEVSPHDVSPYGALPSRETDTFLTQRPMSFLPR